MSLLRRILILPALAGLAFAVFSLVAAVGPASAQTVTGTASLNCTGTWPTSGSCTITPNFSVAPGGQFAVTMPDGTTATISCPSGCLAGAVYTLTPAIANAYTTYASPQTIYPGGACVNGSYPTAYGCTSATVAFAPYYNSYNYNPPVYIQPVPYIPSCQSWWCFNNGNCNTWNSWSCGNNGNCGNWSSWCGNNGNCNNSNSWWCRDHDHCDNGNMMAATTTSGNRWSC